TTPWRKKNFNDATWKSGPAELGYGDGDEATTVGSGPDPANRYITTYFRRVFSVASLAQVRSLRIGLLCDDAAIVYLNGTEATRVNINAAGYRTLARSNLVGA